MAGDEMADLGEAVNNYEDTVVTIRIRKIGNEVKANGTEGTWGSRKGLEKTCRLLPRDFSTSTGIARLNIVLDIGR
jgi:hypothetical protein